MLLSPLLLTIIPSIPAPALGGRLEIHQGRAIVATEEGPRRLGRRSDPLLLTGPGHLELAAGARAEISWTGMASLRLQGPASFAWREVAGQEPLQLEFRSLLGLELEVRRGPVRIDLPQGWRMALEAGAVSLVGLPDGATEVSHRAGGSALLTWAGGATYAPPPVLLHPGERARLAPDQAQPSAVDPSAFAAAWNFPHWPWGNGELIAAPDLPPGPACSWKLEFWPWFPSPEGRRAWESWAWPWVCVEEPVRTPTIVSRTGPWTSWDWPWTDQGEVVASSMADLHAPEADRGPLFSQDGGLWRGVPEEALERHPGFWVELNEHLVIENVREGSRVSLAAHAPKACWFFSDQFDVQLSPGAALLLDRKGDLRYHTGSVSVLYSLRPR
jgi:hypothetical protein